MPLVVPSSILYPIVQHDKGQRERFRSFFSVVSLGKRLCGSLARVDTWQSLWDYLLAVLTAPANLRTMWSDGRENK